MTDTNIEKKRMEQQDLLLSLVSDSSKDQNDYVAF